jgi:hypothetical protein
MRLRTVVTISVPALLATWGSAVTQVPTPPGIPHYQTAIHVLRDSQMVRLHTSALARREGRVLSRDVAEMILAQGASAALNVPVTDVDSLWIRGTAWKTGAILGGAVGVTAMTLLVAAPPCLENCEVTPGGVVAGYLIGLAGGALLGAGIGTIIPKWHRRLP